MIIVFKAHDSGHVNINISLSILELS